MNNLDIAILVFGIAFSFILVYLIDYGMQIKQQLYFFIVAIIPALVYFLAAKKSSFEYLNYGFLTLPLTTITFYNFLNLISWKINKREFRLKIRNSRNMDRTETNWTDRIFSFLLVMNFFAWPISAAFILKNIIKQ